MLAKRMDPILQASRGGLNCEGSMPEPNSQLLPGVKKHPAKKFPPRTKKFPTRRVFRGSGGFSAAPRTWIKKQTHMGRNVVDPQGH